MDSKIIFSTDDEQFMAEAITLAELGGGYVAPNPKVGCVIVHNNQIIGKGFHQQYGEAHAEVNAINSVVNKSLLAESTIYVTLEPCNHYGKTPPCADLIIKHQFKRVVIGSLDPFPLVNGGGINRLKEAGIEVVVGVLQAECDYVNRRFLTFHQKKRPYIILKWAETADGFMDIDRTDKERKINWITGEDSQKLVHQWRSDEQGILVGWKTILNDNPQLNVRLIDGKSPIRIVIDPYLNAPMESNIYNSNQKTLIYNKIKSDLINNLHYIQFETLTFATLLESLYEEQIISVLVEGGKNTLEHFLNNNTWDEIRRFRSVKHFEKGLKSPEINLKPDRTITIGNDKLDYYIFKQ